ncbi:CidA/LrgA family protein [Agaribacterium sp. ZY112]|uniref:CidA/LrgA family protein n=1 Tax=Agaribacterium sp. ZY112 TaxID=3233574 RepID=UPI0035244DC0
MITKPFTKQLQAFVLTALAIALSLFIGRYINAHFALLPSSLWGMLVFAALLATPLLNVKESEQPIAWLMRYMPLVFLPICVGVIEYGALLAEVGWKLVFAGCVSTLLSLLLVARLAKALLPLDRDSQRDE